MRKKPRKLRLNRETIRSLDSGLERVAGGISRMCPETVTDCQIDSACPGCDSFICEGGTFTCSGAVCSHGPCSGGCATGGACTVGC